MKNKTIIAIVAIVSVAILATGCGITPAGRAMFNTWGYAVQRVDDATSYETKKTVEDTCRAMMASYTADRLTYLQYRDNDDEEKQSWAEQAKMRANRTAANYNEYILKNSFVWRDNIPFDVEARLEYIEY